MAKDRWLDAGFDVLADEGVAGLRIDRLARRVGLSKGSFFHHFASAAVYRETLLEEWATRAMMPASTAPPGQRLGDLASRVGDLFDARVEAAVRAWAAQDPLAAHTLARVDAARLAALEQVWGALVTDPRRVRAAALIPHLIVIGAGVARPAPTGDELEDVFALLAELVPAVVGGG